MCLQHRNNYISHEQLLNEMQDCFHNPTQGNLNQYSACKNAVLSATANTSLHLLENIDLQEGYQYCKVARNVMKIKSS
jgi:hypothetical protein